MAQKIDSAVDLIIDDGDKTSGVPSTIVALEEDGTVKLVRQGQIKLNCAL